MGGATISFKVILEGMLDRGCSIIVMISSRNCNNEFINYMISRGCIIVKFDDEMSIYPDIKISKLGSLIKFPWRTVRKLYKIEICFNQILKTIRIHKPDIVHTNIGVLPQGVKACKKLNIPHLWHIREYQNKDFGWRILPSINAYKKLLRSTNTLTITKNILEYFELKNTTSANFLWDGILPAGSCYYKHKKSPFFLCASRISPEKKIDIAIEAFLLIADKLPKYKLIIVGDQHNKPYYEKIKKIILNSNIQERIELHSYRSDVVSLMKDATALVVASSFEGLGRMTIEAAFMGCLVIGRDTGGTKEIIETTGCGYLFNTTEMLSNLMLKVAGQVETEEYKEKALSAQNNAISKSSNENYCIEIYKLYNHIINNHNQ